MGDSAYVILTADSKKTTGKYFLDEEVLASVGVEDFSKYGFNREINEAELDPCIFT